MEEQQRSRQPYSRDIVGVRTRGRLNDIDDEISLLNCSLKGVLTEHAQMIRLGIIDVGGPRLARKESKPAVPHDSVTDPPAKDALSGFHQMFQTLKGLTASMRGGMRPMGNRGITLIELLGAVILVAILVGAAAPVIMTGVQSARFKAAVSQVTGDIHLARSKAVSTGWQYRIRGRDRRGGANANRYRIEGRRTPVIAWPAESDPPQQTADKYVGPWIQLADSYPGIQLDNSATGTNPPFYAGFDSSGKSCTPLTQCFNGVSPLVITKDSTGQTRQVSIAPATGHIRAQ